MSNRSVDWEWFLPRLPGGGGRGRSKWCALAAAAAAADDDEGALGGPRMAEVSEEEDEVLRLEELLTHWLVTPPDCGREW